MRSAVSSAYPRPRAFRTARAAAPRARPDQRDDPQATDRLAPCGSCSRGAAVSPRTTHSGYPAGSTPAAPAIAPTRASGVTAPSCGPRP